MSPDPELTTPLDAPQASRTTGEETNAAATASFRSAEESSAATAAGPSGVPRFRVLRPHAKGGLGEISVACDEELHREVALKEIQGRHADDPGSRRRFLREAEITGGLEHPGIVPVYGLGFYADGRPYYAMRLIQGQSLKDAIAGFHSGDAPGRDPGERAVAFRKLLGRFVDVCNAMSYAHSRGVLHRDLKPANIMLGKYGETLVVDWGLAKSLGTPAGQTVSAESPLLPPSASGSVETEQGAVVGTPQYMSPEQAAGKLDALGPESDIYSLGATLYTLLTGRSPFDVPDRDAVLANVQRGDFPRPRQASRGVPVPLEAVCLKAMALRPRDRYSSARDLADEIERWLADEPVRAHREPWRQRLARWSRRHRAWTQAGAAALVLVTAVSLAATWFVNRAKHEAVFQRNAATAAERAKALQLERTQQALAAEKVAETQARQALANYEALVTDDEVLKDNRFQPLRKKLLADALTYYQEFIRTHRNDPEARYDLAEAIFRVGNISYESGSTVEALAAFQQALALHQELAEEDPKYRADMATDQRKIGQLLGEMDDREAALAHLEQALRLSKESAQANPDSDRLVVLASTYGDLADAQRDVDLNEEALKNFEAALAIYQELAEKNSIGRDERYNLAVSQFNLARQQAWMGQDEAARKGREQALDVFRMLADEDPTHTSYQNSLAVSYHELADQQWGMAQTRTALETEQKALAIYARLAAEDPSHTQNQRGLALLLGRAARLHEELGELDAALADTEQALAISRPLAAAHPDVSDYRNLLIGSYVRLAKLEQKTGRPEAALARCEQDVATFQKLASENPTIARFQDNLAAAHETLAQLHSQMKRPEAALASYQQAVAAAEKLVTLEPGIDEYQNQLALLHADLGDVRSGMGQLDDALVHYQQAVEIDQKLARAKSRIGNLTLSTGRLASLQQEMGQFEAALATYRQAIVTWQQTQRKGSEAGVLVSVAGVLQKMGNLDEALATMQQAVKIQREMASKRPTFFPWSLAGDLSRLAELEQDIGQPDRALVSYTESL